MTFCIYLNILSALFAITLRSFNSSPLKGGPMIPDILTSLAISQASTIAYEAMKKAIDKYRVNRELPGEDGKMVLERHTDDGLVKDNLSSAEINQLIHLIKAKPGMLREDETPIEASRSTREIIDTQLTILEQERNRLIPIAAREHWVALVFAIIAGIVFFTSVGLFAFATITKGVAVFVASALPGFLSKIFFSREAIAEARLKEIASDLRESEKAKERLEILEEALKVIPEEYRAQVLEEFTKSKKPTSARKP